MSFITITSDWRNSDYYLAAVKGRIYKHDPTINVIDITHQIVSYNNMQAAFVIRNCYNDFPEGTIHILAVNSLLSSKRSLLIIEKNKHFFLCSDSGYPDLIFPEDEKKVYQVKVKSSEIGTFSSFDVFVDTAFKIIGNNNVSDFAEPFTDFVHQTPLLPTIDNNLINGSVIYIDSYSNAITNINRETFERVGKGNAFEIYVQSNHYIINRISRSYLDVVTGELVAVFNSAQLLEIAISNGPAAELLNLRVNSAIRIKFSSKKDTNQLQLTGE
jgi:S-adenosyl-L-methionine hydrolase (adenosine-forming)